MLARVSCSVEGVVLPLSKGVSVLKVDSNNLMALHKPTNILTHPISKEVSKRCLLSSILSYDYKQENYVYRDQLPGSMPGATVSVRDQKLQCRQISSEQRRLWLINRLDVGTSGLVLASTSKMVAQAVKAVWKRRAVDKVYYAVVFGQLGRCRRKGNTTGRVGTKRTTRSGGRLESEKKSIQQVSGAEDTALQWVDEICPVHYKQPNHADSSSSGSKSSSIKTAVTDVRVLGISKSRTLSLLELRPRTGFTHQLRLQCARRGLPIVGDRQHGNFAANKELCAQFSTRYHAISASKLKNSERKSETQATENKSRHGDDEPTLPNDISIANRVSTANAASTIVDMASTTTHYGDVNVELAAKRMFLHAHEVQLTYLLAGQKHSFHAVSPVPPEFAMCMQLL